MAETAPGVAPRPEGGAARSSDVPLVRMALVAGGLAALGQAPFGVLPVALAGLLAGFMLWERTAGPREAARVGWALGAGYFGVALVWIVSPFMVDMARHGWMAPFALIGLAGGLALFWAAAFALARWLWPVLPVQRHAEDVVAVHGAEGGFHRGAGGRALVFCWALAELLRAHVLTGFPWALVGYVWLGWGLDQAAALVGPHGLTFLTLLLAWVLRLALSGPRPVLAAGTVMLAVSAAAGLGLLRAAVGPERENRPMVRLVQPNAEQHLKWDPAMIPVFFRRQLAFTAAPPRSAGAALPDLVVWPETAVPYPLWEGGEVARRIAGASGGRPVATGALREAGESLRNSLFLVSGDGRIDAVYDKHHLVPFGEYVPFGTYARRIGLGALVAQGGRFAPGPGPQLIAVPGVGRALPLICYEAIFPQGVNAAPERPDFLMQITNDAWFGTFSGPWQHLAQARFRAIEQGLPMVRVANTGISAMIGPRGKVLAALPLGTDGYLDAPLPAPLPATPYGHSGDLPMWLLLAAGLFRFLSGRFRKSD